MKKIRPLNKFVIIISAILTICCTTMLTPALYAQTEDGKNKPAPEAGLPELLDKLPLEFIPRVGKWVRYKLTERNSGASREITIGVDKAADIYRRVGYWIEISTSSAQGVPVHLRFLYDPKTMDDRRIRRFIVKTDQQPAVEVDASGHKYMLFDSRLSGEWHAPVTEKIKIPAGKFDAQRMRFITDKNEALEVWLSDRIPLIGLLRVTSLNQDLELTGYGSNYQPVVSEQIKFKLPSQNVNSDGAQKE